MHSKLTDFPAVLDIPDGTIRLNEWGGMSIETGTIRNELDPSPFFKGLPDDRCQCPHWGFVLKGQLTFNYADRSEVYRGGEAYYAEPGHLAVLGADTEYVEFSQADKYAETMAVIEKNMAAMAPA
jgi:hypothetical protein